MLLINHPTIENIGAQNIETYLSRNGYKRTEEQRGIRTEDWVNSLLSDPDFSVDDFENFMFHELMFGKRKYIHLYKLDSVRRIKYAEDWLPILQQHYELSSLNFCDILFTRVNSAERRKIAAIRSKENEKGELVRLQIIFVCLVEIQEKSSLRDSYSYIPVDIDFNAKTMYIKVWNRNYVTDEALRAESILCHIQRIMQNTFNVPIHDFGIEHKQTLYHMSKGLVDTVYEHVPAFGQIRNLEDTINDFEQDVLQSLPLQNKIDNGSGQLRLPNDLMDFCDEIKKRIECLAISDFFFDKSYNEIWKMGVSTIISRIKFNDAENILTTLSGEETQKPIFCTKTFMSLRKSMEDAQLVERLWVVIDRSKNALRVRYDTSSDTTLGIMILSNSKYDETDLNIIMELYNTYETRSSTKVNTDY